MSLKEIKKYITVDDCLEKLPDRFALVLLAAIRARDLIHQQPSLLPLTLEDHKATVLALREIAEGKINPSYKTKLNDA